MNVELFEGDITAQDVDAIVNAANSSLLGGGVDGAIHCRGGPGDPRRDPGAARGQVRARAADRPGGDHHGRPIAGDLGGEHGGPGLQATVDRSELLRACYVSSLRVADELSAASVAFPLISAGVQRWPVEDAVRQALTVLRAAEPRHIGVIRLVLFGADPAAPARAVAAE